MSDDRKNPDWEDMSRREALWWLAAAAPIAGLGLGVSAAGQPAPPRNLRVLLGDVASDSPVARGVHPRTYVTPETLAALRAQIASDAAFRARWQVAVSQFEDPSGYWARGDSSSDGRNPNVLAFAAFLTCVRRPNDDLGLTWASSWQTYRDRIVNRARLVAAANESWEWHTLSVAAVYDLLHGDLTADDRAALAPYVAERATKLSYCIGRWDDQKSASHVAKVVCSLAADDARDRFSDLLANTQDWAEGREWIAYQSLGYEWKDAYPTNQGQILCLWMLKNAGGLSAAATTDKHLYHLQHAWMLLREYVIPHPGRTHPLQARTNMVAPTAPLYYTGLNVGAHLLWAKHFLAGRVNLDATTDVRGLAPGPLSDRTTLANSEADYFGYLYDYWVSQSMEGLTDFRWVHSQSPAKPKGHVQTFCFFPVWLILNVQLPTQAVDAAAAGIPLVRRWWPGTLDLTTILSSFDRARRSMITYSHQHYYINSYEGNCRDNGSWQVHRAGPLLIQRGSASHGPLSRKWTGASNGTVSFIDVNLYPLFFRANTDDYDAGGIREAPTSRTKGEVLEKGAASNMGEMTGWYADARAVAVTSDLTRSYNSPYYASPKQPGNEPKVSAFTREFVCVRRGGDGTDHERVFTYDRITLVDTRFEPRYNLCPATNPNIDGVETPFEPWAPQGAPVDGAGSTWYAKGPTRWDYSGATRLIYDNTAEPAVSSTNPSHTAPGEGKVCVTWLRPRGSGVKVTKRGGTNAYVDPAQSPSPDGAPGIGPWNEWAGLDGEWNKVSNLSARAYSGLYTVEVIPATVQLDTRFLMACDVMAASSAPDIAVELATDETSIGARCGASAVVFGRDGVRGSGYVTVPDGVVTIVLTNLPAGQVLVLSANGTLSVTTPDRASSPSGVLVVGVSGSGTLMFG